MSVRRSEGSVQGIVVPTVRCPRHAQSDRRRQLAGGLAIAIGLASAPACSRVGAQPSTRVPTAVADLILVDAAVVTMDDTHPLAQAVAIGGTTLLAVGTRDEALAHRGPNTEVRSLAGHMILPGFHDAHVHPVTGGIELGQCDLNEATSVTAIETRVVECADSQDGEWIVGGGWDLTLFPRANPTAARLDALAPDRPVYLTSADAHSAWVNSAALRRAGIDAQTPDPTDGRIERDPTGAPTGTLRESAMQLVAEHLPPLTADDHLQGLRRGLAMANRFGITSLQEANASPDVLAAYVTLAERGELTARVVAAQSTDPERGVEQLDAIVRRRDAIAHERLRATSVKVFVDGVIEAHTAAMLDDYVGLDHRGEPNWSPEELTAFVLAADARGLDVHAHAIGDRAIRIALDAIAHAQATNPARARRHVIAHLQVIDPADLGRFAELGVVASFQPLWAYADTYITDLTVPFLGPTRSRWLYPIGSVMKTGAVMAAGSDWSVSSMDPLRGMETALTRRSPDATDGPAFVAQERVELMAMLAAYTTAGAYLQGHDARTGSLVTGKQADLVVLDRDLRTIAAPEISDARVVLTLLDGEVVYEAEPAPSAGR